MARAFNGSSDKITCSSGSVTNLSQIVAFTMVAICRPTINNATQYVAPLCGAGSYGIRLDSSGNVTYNGPFGTYSSTPSVTFTGSDGWLLLAITKQSGTSPPRMHKYQYSTNTWTRANSSTGAQDGSAAVTTKLIGNSTNALPFNGDIAAVADFGYAMTDDQVESLSISLTSWLARGPLGMWVLDQQATSQKVIDWTGGGANETALAGTAVAGTSVPVLTYGHPVLLGTHAATAGGGSSQSGSATLVAASSLTAGAAQGMSAAVAMTAGSSLTSTGIAPVLNTFDGGSNGTTITTGNSGSTSGTAFDTVSVVSGGTATFTSTSPYRGALSGQFSSGTTAGLSYAEYSTTLGIASTGQVYGRLRFRLPTLPPDPTGVRVAVIADSTGSFRAELRVTDTGAVSLRGPAGTALATFAATYNAGDWWDVGLAVLAYSATVGQIEAKRYDSAGVVAETLTSAANQNTTGAGGVAKLQAGMIRSVASYTAVIDDVAWSPTAYPVVPSAAGAQSGAAALTAGSAMTVGAFTTQPAAVAMSATSALTAAAVATRFGAVAMTAQSALTATATTTTSGAVALSAQSGLTAAASTAQGAAAAMSAASNLTSAATVLPYGAATLTATSTLATGATRVQPGAVTMTAVSGLTADTSGGASAAVSLTAQSSITVAGTQIIPGATTMTAQSSLTTTAVRGTAGATAMTAASNLAVAAVAASTGGAAMTAQSTLTAGATLAPGGGVAMTAQTGLVADGRLIAAVSAVMSAQSALTVNAGGTTAGATVMSASSALTAAAVRQANAAAVLTALSNLAVAATTGGGSAANLTAATGLTTAAVYTAQGAVSLSAITQVVAGLQAAVTAQVSMSARSNLTVVILTIRKPGILRAGSTRTAPTAGTVPYPRLTAGTIRGPSYTSGS
jgi:hypothetical protein